MPSTTRPLMGIALCAVLSAPAAAQGMWVGHQDPCQLSTGHFLISGAVLYLKQAVETQYADQREGRLSEALRVLTEAVTERDQGENPAAWYYLGRYYTLVNDPAGADSAFRRAGELETSCRDDIVQYTSRLGPYSLNEALRTWGAGHPDSAAYHFDLAASLLPADPEVPLYRAIMFSSQGELDSAARYVRIGRELARTDTTRAARLQQALLELARGFETRAYQNPAILRAPTTRVQRDSVNQIVARDSTRLAAMVGQVQEIRDRGRRLDPQSLRAFQQESTTVATGLAAARAARDSLGTSAAADSAEVLTAVAPAIEQYEAYHERFPDDVTAAMSLARLYSAAGKSTALNALIERIVASGQADAGALVQGGMSLFNEGQHRAAVRMLEAALEKNPNDRAGLLTLCRAYYAVEDGNKLMPAARRLNAIDPLNANSVRMLALAWVLADNRDSVNYYVAMADSGLGWHVDVQQFLARENLTRVTGSIRNIAARALPATSLAFEFLDSNGTVLFTEIVEVPALDPRGRERLTIRRQEGEPVAWRYRRQ